jgi:NAD(P)-dependent dehydrogenase (short-subunit alcohol dehydrogenase family)
MLDESVVVITGGAGLLGRVFSRSVARAGGIAVIADIDLSAAERVAEEVAADYPGKVHATALDITDEVSVRALITHVSETCGTIDAVVNSAYPRNLNYGRKLEQVTYADFCDNVSRHLGGYFLVSQQFGIAFRAQGGGTIINIASIYGIAAPRFDVYAGTTMTMPVEYAAIKSAVLHLTQYFAQYFKGSNIRVNAISPGGIVDNQPAQFQERYRTYAASKGMLDPADIEGALLFLLSDMSRFVNGQNIVVDDGWTL